MGLPRFMVLSVSNSWAVFHSICKKGKGNMKNGSFLWAIAHAFLLPVLVFRVQYEFRAPVSLGVCLAKGTGQGVPVESPRIEQFKIC